jgi:OHCU decarboxylase
MTATGLERLHALSHDDAVAEFAQCCASRDWAEAMAAGRPFLTEADLYAAADRIWNELGSRAWHDAFDGHPRIGERKAAAPTTDAERHWSAQEQSGMDRAADGIRSELAGAQREYEQRFGHIFLICATGLSAADMLAALRARLHNEPAAELRVAAGEQRRITRLRLEKLLTI